MARRRPLRNGGTATMPRPVVKTAPPSLKTSLLFLALALYLGSTVFRLCLQEWNLYQQGQILSAEKAEVLAQNQALRTEIARSKTNAGIERLAREQLGLVMAQEIPVKTVGASPAPAVGDAPAVQTARGQGGPIGLPPAMASLAKLLTPPWQSN